MANGKDPYEQATVQTPRPDVGGFDFGTGPAAPSAGGVAHTEVAYDPGFGYQQPDSTNETQILRPTGPSSLAWLVVINRHLSGHMFRLDPRGMIIGRDTRCEIQLDDEFLGGLHAKVWADGEEEGRLKFVIQDLASKNGTFINGASDPAIRHALKDGDRITVGETKLVFKQV